jgi:hypothetical protein
MWASISRGSFCVFVTACLAGCGGSSGSGSTGGGGGGGNPTTVTYSFTRGTPTAVATQIGTGAYTQTTLQSNTLTLSIPSGTTDYSIAYVCPTYSTSSTSISGGERVIKASTQDGTSFSLICAGAAVPDVGTATVQVDASAISGAAFVSVGPHLQPWSGTTLSFSVEMLSGTHDVAVYATDAHENALAVRILRNQTIPGALNGGNTVALGSSDLTVPQAITYNNVPSGFAAPSTMAEYLIDGGNALLDMNATSQYMAVPSSEVQSGGNYAFTVSLNSIATPGESIFIQKPPGNSGGPQSFTFPAPWSYAGPTAAALPTFNFDYTGFSGSANVLRSAILFWGQGTTLSEIAVSASANYQNGATTISIPELSGLTGFIASAPTGTTVSWFAGISQGVSVDSLVTGSTVSSVENSGTYTEP